MMSPISSTIPLMENLATFGADDFAAVGFVIDEFVEEFTILWDYSLANLLDNEQFICIKGYFYV